MVLAKLSIVLLHRSAENPSASGFLYRNRECRPRSADSGRVTGYPEMTCYGRARPGIVLAGGAP